VITLKCSKCQNIFVISAIISARRDRTTSLDAVWHKSTREARQICLPPSHLRMPTDEKPANQKQNISDQAFLYLSEADSGWSFVGSMKKSLKAGMSCFRTKR